MNPKKFRGWCLNGCGAAVPLRNTQFCSRVCRKSYDFESRVRLIEDGIYPAVKNPGSFIRRYLIKKHGEQCSRCGWNQRHRRTGKVPVEVEHIDGNWENNTPENLTLLCPNCHSLTDTFRGLNRGNGRRDRLGGRNNPFRKTGHEGQ